MNDHTANIALLTGQDNSCLVDCNGLWLHRHARPDWQALQRIARVAGFDLVAVSAHRSFDRQLCIWNEKACGQRPVLDAAGSTLDTTRMTPDECLFAILRWSALPGASRHHWGTDIDVVDRAAIPDEYAIQLTDSEVYGAGPFAAMHDWLDTLIEHGNSYGFYRPYNKSPAASAGEGGLNTSHTEVPGVAAERWHLSHRPTSRRFEECLSIEALRTFYSRQENLLLQQVILENFEAVYSHYICV